jgi:DNA-directed RNA polymerase specialized sigma24 family protein
LPEAQPESPVLRHWHGWSMEEIEGRPGKTRAAVAGLIKRGLRGLRERLQRSE